MDKKILGADAAAVESAGSIDAPQLTHAAPTHTPGPWRVLDREDCIHVVSEDTMFQTGCISFNGNGLSNAHLIAAAPELLAALKKCAPLWDFALSEAVKTFVLRHHERVTFDELGEQVKTAIAKAEGR